MQESAEHASGYSVSSPRIKSDRELQSCNRNGKVRRPIQYTGWIKRNVHEREVNLLTALRNSRSYVAFHEQRGRTPKDNYVPAARRRSGHESSGSTIPLHINMPLNQVLDGIENTPDRESTLHPSYRGFNLETWLREYGPSCVPASQSPLVRYLP